MATLHNEITVNAPMEKVWRLLANPELLDQYDPTVKKSILLSKEKTGFGAKRKVMMADGKNWFEEKVTSFKPNETLTYELTDCSFPIKSLTHTYTFETSGNQTKVKQVIQYSVKFGLLGKLLDGLVMRRQSDAGVKKFFAGFKFFAEAQ